MIACFSRKGREANRILYLVTGSSEKPSLTSDEMLSKITRFARGLFPINSTDIGFSFGGMCGNAENRQFRGVLLLRHISKLLQEVVVFSQNFCQCIRLQLGISDSMGWDDRQNVKKF